MRFDTSQHMKLGQQMKLAPRMIQSMEILQMPLAELEERIEQELESNPTLELAQDEGDRREMQEARDEIERDARDNERPLTIDENDSTRDFERLESFSQDNPDVVENEEAHATPERTREFEPGDFSRARNDGERDAKMDAMAAAPARSLSLSDQLLDQWHLADVSPEIRAAGELIIAFIEDDGFLRTPLETIADRAPEGHKPPIETLTLALSALQQMLEPPGIAARDRREALLLQVDAMRDAALVRDPALEHARVLIDQHLEDLSQNRIPRIAEKTGLTPEQIALAKERMKGLSLAPARQLVNETPQAITPDAIVEYDEESDKYVAFLNDARLPNLRINRDYAMMAKDRAVPTKDRDFLKKNLSNAQWLIDAVGQRRGTMLRVIAIVLEEQRDFFDLGPQAMKPLPMTLVADRLGIHVATVSRAVSEKYLQTPRGIVPLRKFFTGGLATESGSDMSYDAVRAALQEVIAAEDKGRPLSDDALAEELKKRGIEIARRTVAKYREQLNIPSARLRKTF
jgi:RNA polymerase sigma-54 factor